MATLQSVYEEAGRPGATAFRFAARRAGLQVSDVESKAFVGANQKIQYF